MDMPARLKTTLFHHLYAYSQDLNFVYLTLEFSVLPLIVVSTCSPLNSRMSQPIFQTSVSSCLLKTYVVTVFPRGDYCQLLTLELACSINYGSLIITTTNRDCLHLT